MFLIKNAKIPSPHLFLHNFKTTKNNAEPRIELRWTPFENSKLFYLDDVLTDTEVTVLSS